MTQPSLFLGENLLQRESKNNSQARSSSSKPITVLKPLSIEGNPQLQHLNLVFDMQDSPSPKKSEDSITTAVGEEHQNTEEPMSTQELLNTMVASQIQLREDMNLMVHVPMSESEKKINEKISKMGEMIKRHARWKTSWIISSSLFSQM